MAILGKEDSIADFKLLLLSYILVSKVAIQGIMIVYDSLQGTFDIHSGEARGIMNTISLTSKPP